MTDARAGEEVDIDRLVRDILRHEWPKIDSFDLPELVVGPMRFMIMDQDATTEDMAAVLTHVVQKRLGLAPHEELSARCQRVAEALVDLRPQIIDSRDVAVLAWSRRIAELAVDALVSAELVRPDDFRQATNITMEEIAVRLTLQDRPPFDD